jgi:IclR family transcriptional regulator, acetate operon repressor
MAHSVPPSLTIWNRAMKEPQTEAIRWAPDGRGEPPAVAGTALIGKAFRLIDLIGAAPGLVSAAELATATGWPKATLYRILASVTAHGFVRFDPLAQGYTLGYRLLELAQNVWAAPDLAAIASVELQRLRDMTGETAYLAVPHDGAVLSLGKFESPHDIRSAARLGVRKPLHCTSQGKAILAFLPEAEAEAMLGREPLERFTPHTVTDRDTLMTQLRIIRARGYAVEDQEILPGNRCVGAPVLDSTGRPVAAISVAGPVYRLTRERVDQLGPEVANVARNIGLGLRGTPARQSPAGMPWQPHPSHRTPVFHGAHPVWAPERSSLVWADRLGPSLFITSGARTATFRPEPGAPIDGLSVTAGGEVVLLLGGRILRIDRGECVFDRAVPELAGTAAMTTDPAQQHWVAVQQGEETRIGKLDADGTIETVWTLRGRIGALAWSRSGETLYASDPQRGTIHLLRRDGAPPRLFTRIARVSGEPRSLAVDADDRLWVGLYDGWSIARLTTEGEIERLLPLPVPRPTGLAFGGDSDGQIYVTTARIGLAREVLENAPLSGHLLVAPTARA